MRSARRAVSVLVAMALAGCSGETPSEPVAGAGGSGGDECEPPNRRLADGRCVTPGVQDDGCSAGTLGLEDGSCQPPGIHDAAQCADGFELVADGCEPLLPTERCAAGLMGVPGETTCREVAPCPDGPWPDIPDEADTQYVDRSYPDNDSDGSAASPWTSIGAAVDAASAGAIVAIAAGSYAEDVSITGKAVRLWGACPADVEVVGSLDAQAAVNIGPGASGTELRALAVRGESMGVATSGAQEVVLHQIWVHDTGLRAIHVKDTLGPTEVTLSDSLIEGSRDLGVYVSGADALIERTAVRGILPYASDQTFGRGINIQQNGDTEVRSNVTVRASIVEDSYECGIFVGGALGTIEGSVIRGILPQASDSFYGRGVMALDRTDTATPADLVLRGSLIEDTHDSGVDIMGSTGTIESTVIRRIEPEAASGNWGTGIQISDDLFTGERSTATVRSSLVEHSTQVGIGIIGSDATIESTVVRFTTPGSVEPAGGRAVCAQQSGPSSAPATLTLRGSLLEDNCEAGIMLFSAKTLVEGVHIRRTVAAPPANVFGDGIVSFEFWQVGSLLIAESLLEDCERAGIMVLDHWAHIRNSALECPAIDMDRQVLFFLEAGVDDLGGNRCGCGDASWACTMQTSNVEPPVPMADHP